MSETALQPACLSLLICDAVYQEPFTRKTTILGMMVHIPVMSVPFVYPPFCVHFSLTHLRGTYEIRIIIKHERTGEVISQTPAGKERVTCDDPRGQLDGTVRIESLRFPHEGLYRFSLLLNGTVVAERHVELRLPPPREPPTTPPRGT